MIYPTTTVADPESSGMKMPRQATFLHYGSIDQTAIIRELKMIKDTQLGQPI